MYNGGCEQYCHNNVGSYSCSCNNGFNLNTDNHHNCTGKVISCFNFLYIESIQLDINECSTNNGDCEQVCFNTIGSFYCACTSGYNLMSGKYCSGKISSTDIAG